MALNIHYNLENCRNHNKRISYSHSNPEISWLVFAIIFDHRRFMIMICTLFGSLRCPARYTFDLIKSLWHLFRKHVLTVIVFFCLRLTRMKCALGDCKWPKIPSNFSFLSRSGMLWFYVCFRCNLHWPKISAR